MKRKWLAFGIILLFLGSGVIPLATSQQTSSRKIITVDDEPGDADFTSIKEALNHSNPGDTIEVYSGTYYEDRIIINIRGIILKGIAQEVGDGNDTGKPIMNTTLHYTIFNVRSDDVTITNFVMIDNSHNIYNELARIWGDNCTFSNNDISGGFNAIYAGGDEYYPDHHPSSTRIIRNTVNDTSTGVYLCGPNGNISYNRFLGCNYRAIRIWDGSNTTLISHNIISNCSTGIEYASGSNTIISYNIISGVWTGIDLGAYPAKNISIILNEFTKCSNGITMGISRDMLQVRQNNFINNTRDIRFTQLFPLKYNLIFNRIFNGNYYDSWQGTGPKLIWGTAVIFVIPILIPDLFFYIPIPIPWFYRDLYPAQEPYDIIGMK
jgi:nitrous oxidase accessory protein